MWQHNNLLSVYMCSLALALEQAGLVWPGWPPYTRPKGPGHPIAGQGVNCLPLGPSGHWSSPGGQLCCVHSVQLNLFQEVQVYTVYKGLVVQRTNSTIILDNCTAKLTQLKSFSSILPKEVSRIFCKFLQSFINLQGYLEVSTDPSLILSTQQPAPSIMQVLHQ